MKKEWVRPSLYAQEFEATEYVAACYAIACRRGSEGPQPSGYGSHWSENEYGNPVSHSAIGTSKTCGDKYANRIITNENGVIISMDENNSIQGWISGGLDYWIDKNYNGICDDGDLIYWHTLSNDGKRRWNHWGYAEGTDADHPNHS